MTVELEAADTTDAVDSVLQDWARERPELDTATIGVFGRLSRVVAQQRAILNAHYEKYDLTLASFDVLANLRRSGFPHRKTAGELASSSMLTTGGVTFRLDRMEEQNLIERIRSKADRRVVYAQLTEHGKEVVDSVFDEHMQIQREMLAGLSSEEQEELSQLLKRAETSIARYQKDRSKSTT